MNSIESRDTKGILYGVGVGPGDPELMTLKAARIIRENDVFVIPGADGRASRAYEIAVRVVPELEHKEILPIEAPMVMNLDKVRRPYQQMADSVATKLEQNKNVVFLTIGDPGVFSTFSYLQGEAEARGYRTQLVSGVTSFCAASAELNIPLAIWDESIHIIPSAHGMPDRLSETDNYVFMKCGNKLNELRELIVEENKTESGSAHDIALIENCGMDDEKIYRGIQELPEKSGYFSIALVTRN